MTPEARQKLIHAGVIAARIIIGVIFVVSGMAKDIDLWGTVYKIEEYLHVWHVFQPRTIVFMASILLSCGEFILGALLILGCLRRSVPVLMLCMMAFMLPLTLYIYISNPVSDCGCFGDFIVLSNGATFWKNVVITAILIFLLKFNRSVEPMYGPSLQWVVVALLAAYAIAIGLYGYNIQPMIDFRSFPVGSHILPNDDDADSDDDDISFIYEKDGRRETFTLPNLPDSTWTYVDRVEPERTADSPTELVVYDLDGNEATAEAIWAEGEEMILVVPQIARAEISWTYFLNELREFMENRGGTMVGLIAGDRREVAAWSDLSMASYPVYTAESTTLKELARGNMALVYLIDGKVVWKRSMTLMDTDLTDSLIFDHAQLEKMRDNGPKYFKVLTATLLSILLLIYILYSTGRMMLWSLISLKYAKDEEE